MHTVCCLVQQRGVKLQIATLIAHACSLDHCVLQILQLMCSLQLMATDNWASNALCTVALPAATVALVLASSLELNGKV